MRLLQYLVQRKPSDEILAPCEDLLPALERFSAGVRGEPGGNAVRFRVMGAGVGARMVLQAADRPNDHHGLADFKCNRDVVGSAGAGARDIDFRVELEAFRSAVGRFTNLFEFTNMSLSVLPPCAAYPKPVLRLHHEGGDGMTARLFLNGAPSR